MADGTVIAYDLYLPDGAMPAGGWPGVVVLHGLGGSKDDMAPVAQVFASHGYAALAYSDRGSGTSTGNLELAGPNETSDERALESFFAGLPQVSDTRSVRGASPTAAARSGTAWPPASRTRLRRCSRRGPTSTARSGRRTIARSGIVAGFANAVAVRSPLITQYERDAIQSLDPPAIKTLTAPRSALMQLPSIKTPVYMFQGRVDYAFDVTQAENGYTRIKGPKHLYIGQFGHPPSTFPGPDINYVYTQGLAWFDHYLKGMPNGIDTSKPVTIAAATGTQARVVRRDPADQERRRRLPRHVAAAHGPALPGEPRDLRRPRS